MTTTTETKIRGGAWLFDEQPGDVFTPERLSDEHRMMAQTTEEFVAADLQMARAAFDEIVGTRTSDDVLRHIFERFCIGK